MVETLWVGNRKDKLDMNRTTARQMFVFGEIHPVCIGCNGVYLRASPVPTLMPDGNYWKAYECQSCRQRFIATVEI